MQLARALIDEARTDDQRRLLVLHGSPAATRGRATRILDSLDVALTETAYVGPTERFRCNSLGYDRTADLLGTTQTVVVLDCHERCEPNHLGQLVGTVDGGGLFVLLTPPLESWPARRDEFDETLAVLPFERSDVTGHFRARLVQSLRGHRGVAVVDADSGAVERDGHVPSGPSPSTRVPGLPTEPRFPREAYEQCLTDDQVTALSGLEALGEPGHAVVIEATRGRGKSAAAGLATASLAAAGRDVVVTGPGYRNVATLFEHAETLLGDLEAVTATEKKPRRLETSTGRLRYVPAPELDEALPEADCVVVDEAATLPVDVLSVTLAAPSVAYVTTTHGYEGTGRGFAVRFRERLDRAAHEVTEVGMTEPVRFSGPDPVEVWSFRALALGASPPVEEVVTDATPDRVTVRSLSGEQLLADEALLEEVLGLLVLAHYRTEPNDLQRLLDAPNVSVHGLFYDGHPVSVALLAREGGLDEQTRAAMYQGRRIRGNMLPDVLTSQLRDEAAGVPTGYRVMRIATHDAVRSRGLGSRLLSALADGLDDADWLGVGFGATPDLVEFWGSNGFEPVHLSTTRNRRSGLHSAVMLRPLSGSGEQLLDRHARRLQRRLPATLPDALSTIDADAVRELCTAMETSPAPELTDWEWRHAASVATGPGIFETAPRGVRRLAFRALTDSDGPSLSVRRERLLVRRVLQLRPPEEVAEELGFASSADCLRALGEVVGSLLEAYGPAWVGDEQRRLG